MLTNAIKYQPDEDVLSIKQLKFPYLILMNNKNFITELIIFKFFEKNHKIPDTVSICFITNKTPISIVSLLRK